MSNVFWSCLSFDCFHSFDMRLPSYRTLGQICVYTSFAGISAVMLMRHKIIEDIRNAECKKIIDDHVVLRSLTIICLLSQQISEMQWKCYDLMPVVNLSIFLYDVYDTIARCFVFRFRSLSGWTNQRNWIRFDRFSA